MKTIIKNLVNKIKTNDGISHDSIYNNIDYETTIQINKQVESDGYWLMPVFGAAYLIHNVNMKSLEMI